MKWDTTANKDGDLAIFEAESKQLVGVATSTIGAMNIVQQHNDEVDTLERQVRRLQAMIDGAYL